MKPSFLTLGAAGAALAAALFVCGDARAQQTMLQAGPWTPGHVPQYSSPTGSTPVVTDSGLVPTTQVFPNVVTNLALTQLPSTFAGQVMRTGYYAVGDSPAVIYTSSNSPCSLNSGSGDGGSQIPTSDGKCWLLKPSPLGQDFRTWGARSAVSDNSTLLAAATLAQTNSILRIEGGPFPLQNSTTVAGTIDIEGSGGGGGIYSTTCTSGLRQNTANINILTLKGTNSIFNNVCIDSAVSNTSGTELVIYAGANSSHVTNSQFNGACWAVDFGGGGATQLEEAVVAGNTITSEVASNSCGGFRVGQGSTGGAVGDLRMDANTVYCNTGYSTGLLVLDAGGLTTEPGNVFSYNCGTGTKIFPGLNQVVIWTKLMAVQGDTDAGNAILIDTADASAVLFSVTADGAWASDSQGGPAVLVQNTAGSTNIGGFYFRNMRVYMATNQDGFDLKVGASAQIQNSVICAPQTSSGIGILLEGTVSSAMVQNNQIGTCDHFTGGPLATGVSFTSSAANLGQLDGNSFSLNVTTPINWAPGTSVPHFVLGPNFGVTDVTGSPITAASSITLPFNPVVYVSGATPIATILPVWTNRTEQIVNSGVTAVTFVSGGNMCAASFSINPGTTMFATYNAGSSCWLEK